ncbi:MAG: hypothetical protein QM784_39495 [Polyangiaceae bacterium]
MKFQLIVLGCIGATVACASDGGESAASLAQAELVSSQRNVATPIVRVYDAAAGKHVVVVDPLTQKPLSAWDGKYMEMLAADEYVKCVAEVGGMGRNVPFPVAREPLPMVESWMTDPEMARISDFVSQNQCARTKYGTPPVFPSSAVTEWANRRTDPECNRAASDGEPAAAIALPDKNPSETLIDSFIDHRISPSNQFALTASEHTPRNTDVDAYEIVYRASVNLCFAKHLNALLEEPEIFTATTEEHLLLVGLAQERAQVALMKLGHILKLAARDGSGMPMTDAGGDAGGAYLRYWLNQHPEQLDVVRSRFLTALQLEQATSTAFASYLERQAGARWTSEDGATAYMRDWGAGSARARLLSLVFGGGALQDLWESETWTPISWFSEIPGGNPRSASHCSIQSSPRL